jgi:hypothetical protein
MIIAAMVSLRATLADSRVPGSKTKCNYDRYSRFFAQSRRFTIGRVNLCGVMPARALPPHR